MKLVFDFGNTMSLIIWDRIMATFFGKGFFASMELFARNLGIVPAGKMDSTFYFILPLENDNKFCTSQQLVDLLASIRRIGIKKL